MGRYRVLIKTSAAREIEAVDRRKDRQRIVSRIRSLTENPRPPGCEQLSGGADKYRIRHGHYRIIYSVDDTDLLVYVVKVGHRKDVYR